MLELLHHHHHHAGSTNALSGPLAWKVLFQRRRRNSPCRDMGIKLAFNGCAHCTRSLSTLRISSPVHSYTSALTLPTTIAPCMASSFRDSVSLPSIHRSPQQQQQHQQTYIRNPQYCSYEECKNIHFRKQQAISLPVRC